MVFIRVIQSSSHELNISFSVNVNVNKETINIYT